MGARSFCFPLTTLFGLAATFAGSEDSFVFDTFTFDMSSANFVLFAGRSFEYGTFFAKDFLGGMRNERKMYPEAKVRFWVDETPVNRDKYGPAFACPRKRGLAMLAPRSLIRTQCRSSFHLRHLSSYVESSWQHAIRTKNVEVNALVCIAPEQSKVTTNGPLRDVTVAVKDNICTKDMPTSCSSAMLRGANT